MINEAGSFQIANKELGHFIFKSNLFSELNCDINLYSVYCLDLKHLKNWIFLRIIFMFALNSLLYFRNGQVHF